MKKITASYEKAMAITPWTKRKILRNGISVVTQGIHELNCTLLKDYGAYFDNKPMITHYIYTPWDSDIIIAVDNRAGNMCQEEFASVSKAVEWLCGEVKK